MPNATVLDQPVSLDQRLDPIQDQRLEPILDQRQTERREIVHPAMVSLLGTTREVLHGMVRNVSEGGTQVQLDEPVLPSTLVKIEYEDNLLLGEVIYCEPAQYGWLVGVKIEHGLFELTAITKVMQTF